MKRTSKSGNNRFVRFGLKSNVGRRNAKTYRGGVRQ